MVYSDKAKAAERAVQDSRINFGVYNTRWGDMAISLPLDKNIPYSGSRTSHKIPGKKPPVKSDAAAVYGHLEDGD